MHMQQPSCGVSLETRGNKEKVRLLRIKYRETHNSTHIQHRIAWSPKGDLCNLVFYWDYVLVINYKVSFLPCNSMVKYSIFKCFRHNSCMHFLCAVPKYPSLQPSINTFCLTHIFIFSQQTIPVFIQY